MTSDLLAGPRFDDTSMGFITFDALCRPGTQIPPGGDTYSVEELTLAVSGAAGLGSQAGVRDDATTQTFIATTPLRPRRDGLVSDRI